MGERAGWGHGEGEGAGSLLPNLAEFLETQGLAKIYRMHFLFVHTVLVIYHRKCIFSDSR